LADCFRLLQQHQGRHVDSLQGIKTGCKSFFQGFR
jgi:hypothetical protein